MLKIEKVCTHCGGKLIKHGHRYRVRDKIQRYICVDCKRTTVFKYCVCPYCGGELVKNGHRYNLRSKIQRYKCKRCGRSSNFRKYPMRKHSDNIIDTALKMLSQGVVEWKISSFLHVSPSSIHLWKKELLEGEEA